jgi:phage terminase large subunit-like protein
VSANGPTQPRIGTTLGRFEPTPRQIQGSARPCLAQTSDGGADDAGRPDRRVSKSQASRVQRPDDLRAIVQASMLGPRTLKRQLQGTAKHVIWIDEDAPMDAYTEALMRTMMTNGLVMVHVYPLEWVHRACSVVHRRSREDLNLLALPGICRA